MQWLLNYRGGSFILPFDADGRTECLLKGVGFEVIPPARLNAILAEIASPEVNADAVKLEKAPKIAVYSPKEKKPWDDAVTLALTYAEIPYDVVYDSEILDGCLKEYDWLHLHHEDLQGRWENSTGIIGIWIGIKPKKQLINKRPVNMVFQKFPN